MATAVYIEGFEAGVLGWLGATGITASVKRSGDYSLQLTPVTTGTASKDLLPPAANGTPTGSLDLATAYYRFYVRFAALPGSASEIFAEVRSAAALKARLTIASTGAVAVLSASGTTLGTSTATLSVDTWYEIEFQVGTGTDAAWSLRIDENVEASGTSSLIGASNNAYLRLGKTLNLNGQGYDAYYDDVRVDSDGFPGAGSIVAMHADSVGADADWVSSAGGASTASDVAAIDTVYATTSTNGAAQTYGLETAASAGISSDIGGVMVMAHCRDVGGTSALAVRTRSGSNVADTDSVNITANYGIQARFFATEPVSGDPWTTALLNALEVGVVSAATEGVRCELAIAQVEFVPAAGNAPAAPSDLAVDATDGNSIDLSWTDNSGASDDQEDAFEVQYDTSPAFLNPTSITSIAADSETHTVTGLEPTTTYYFRIRAGNGVGNSAWSASATGATTTDGRTTLTQDEIALTFDAAYEVGRYACGGGYFAVADGSGDFVLNSVAESSPGVASTIGGVMVDPGADGFATQGLDSRIVNYDAGLNESLPLTVNVATGGPKTIWVALLLDTPEVGGGASGMRSIVQLTVVPSSPGVAAIKPTGYYVSGGKRELTTADVDFDAITPTAIPMGASEPDWTDIYYHQRGFVKIGGIVSSAEICPTLYQKSYPPTQSVYTNEMLLGAISDSEARNDLILRIVRCYLDIQALADLGDTAFTTLGGFGVAGKGLWFFGGVFLGDSLTLPSTVTYASHAMEYFHEDACCFLGDAVDGYPSGKPLYGRDHEVAEAQYANHDLRDLDGVREPHWLLTDSGTAQATSATSITLDAGASAAVGNRIYCADNDETRTITAWDNGTKVATVDAWDVTPASDTAYERYIGGGYQSIGSYSIVGAATAVVLAGLTAEWIALGGEPEAFFAYVKRWVDEEGLINPRWPSGYGGGDVSFYTYGDTAGTWGELFYGAAEGDWPTLATAPNQQVMSILLLDS